MELKQEIEPGVQHLIDKGYTFNPGDYIKKGWEILNKDMGQFLLFTFVYFIIQGAVNVLTSSIGGGGSNNFGAYSSGNFNFEDLMTAGQILSSSTSWILGIALAPLALGTYIVARKVNKNLDYQFKDFFSGYNWFVPLILASLLTGMITMFSGLILTIPWVIIGVVAEFPIPLVVVVAIILFLPVFYFAIAFAFTNLFIIYRDYNFWPAMQASRKLITKNWWGMFGFMFLIGLINLAGALLCGVGLLFTIPLSACATYAAYQHVMDQSGMEEDPVEETPDVEDPFGFGSAPPPPAPESSAGDHEDPFLN